MTLYLPDWSNNNWNSTAEALAACDSVINHEGYSGIIHKVSEGNYFGDTYWPAVRDWCNQNNVPYIGYHYVTTDNADQQAAKWNANGGGPFAMLDFENNSGDIGNFWNVVGAFNRAGVTVVLSYIPRWYWQNIGKPDISTAPGLIASNYVNGDGYASQLYPGDGYSWYDPSSDGAGGWMGYGGVNNPVLWQFSDHASMAGITSDVNAFRGTIDQLRALLAPSSPAPAPAPPPPPPPPQETIVADPAQLAVAVVRKLDGVAGPNDPSGTPTGKPLAYYLVDQDRPRVPGDEPRSVVTTPSQLDHLTHIAKTVTGRLWLDEQTGLDLWDMMAVYVLNLVEVKGVAYVKQLIETCPAPPQDRVAERVQAQQNAAAISWDTYGQ